MPSRGLTSNPHLAQATSLLGFGLPVALIHVGALASVAGVVAATVGLVVGINGLARLARGGADRHRIYPTVLTAVLTAVAAMAGAHFRAQSDRLVRTAVTEEARRFDERLNSRIDDVTTSLRRFATRLEVVGLRQPALLEVDAHSYLEQVHGLRRLGVTHARLRVTWSYPAFSRRQLWGISQDDGGPRSEAFGAARAQNGPVLSRLTQLRTGEPGFVVPVPITRGPLAGGAFYGTISAHELFAAADVGRGLGLDVREGDEVLYRNDLRGRAEFTFTMTVGSGLARWTVNVAPTDEFVARASSNLQFDAAVLGTVLALLLGLIAQIWARHQALTGYHDAWRDAVLGGVDSAIVSTDASGIIQTFNPSAERLLGYTAAELIGKAHPGIFHLPEEVVAHARRLSVQLGRDIAPGFEAFVTMTLASGRADETEWTFRRKDGSTLPATLTISPLRTDDGRTLGFIGIIVDLTERRRAEERLRTALARLERVIDSTGAGIFERGYLTGDITYLDQKARGVFGFTADEPVTMPRMLERVAPASRDAMFAAIAAHVRQRSARYDVEIHLPAAGERPERWVRSQGQVKFTDDTPNQLTTTMTDVTEQVLNRRRLEAALGEARAATEAKSAFLSNMSHEMRTPLNGILGLSRQLDAPNLDAEQRESIDAIVRSGENLLAIVGDILDFTKLDAGEVMLAHEPFDPARVVTEATARLEPSARSKSLVLRAEVAESLGARVLGDGARVGQILSNLVGNATKFTHRGSVIVRAAPAGLRVRFEVIDTGIGIAEGDLGRLFQPFSQADESTTRRFGGTGLGLSIAKRLVEAMNGEIGVTSVFGRGSTFWFEVPLPPAIEDGTVTSRAARILVAEDNVINQRVVSATLRKLGYEPVVVANGRQAIDELDRADYALILMDCQMPTLDGYEATRLLRADATHAGLPIIAMTAHVRPGEREKCLDAGMSDYITKPFDPRVLHEMIERHLRAA